jgi:flagellar biosynthesis/type III secretory pathway protein FliH
MSFVALRRGAAISVSTDQLLLDADEVIACERAIDLLATVEAVHARAAEVAERMQREAFAQGLAEGRAEALRATAPALLARWQAAADAALQSHAATQEAVVSLAMHVLRRVAGEWGAAEAVTALARHAWQALSPEQRAVLRVHPQVHEAVQQALRESPASPHAAALDIRADASLDLFDCVFDTPAGQLIASLPDQLARIESGLLRAAREAAPAGAAPLHPQDERQVA